MVGRANGSYYFRASYIDQFNGKRIRKYQTGFKTKKEALKKEQEFISKSSVIAIKDLYLEDVMNDYLAHRKPYIQITSYNNIQRICKTYIIPHFTRKKIHEITKLDCRQFVGKIAEIDRKTKTKNDIITALKSLFNHAEEYFELKSNPTRIIKRLPNNSEDRFTSNVWTTEEFNLFISSFDMLDTEEKRWATFFTVAFWTGARRGEILALQFSDVDFVKKSISINKSVTQKRKGQGPILKSTKTKSSVRTVSLDDKTFEMIQNEYLSRRRVQGFNKDQFIFSRMDNPYNPFADTTIENRKNKVAKENNLKKIRFHDFRHSHASVLIASGVDIVVVSARLGHSSTDLTYNIYVHLLPSAERRALETINSIRK